MHRPFRSKYLKSTIFAIFFCKMPQNLAFHKRMNMTLSPYLNPLVI